MSTKDSYVIHEETNHESVRSLSFFPPIQILSSILLRRQFTNTFSFTGDDEDNMVASDSFYSDEVDESDLFGGGRDSNNNNPVLPLNISSQIIPILYHKFDLPEFGVFGAVLLLSAAIGVFYGCFGKGHKSTEEYLFANRQVAALPAALSLLCSFVSAITILGNPAEIYLYGSSYGLILLSFIPMTISLAYFYVPVFHNLGLSSAYEYFELRFSRSVRIVVSLVGILHYIVYMAIVVYGPSLALSQVTGISTRLSTGVIFSVCIFYSTLGGLKGVIVTDALQAAIIFVSLSAVVYKGMSGMGGFEAVWNIAEQSQRTEFMKWSIDPRVRHTMWTAVIGGYVQWLANFTATHSQVQRYLSMPSMASVRRALLLNFIGLVVIFSLCYAAGLALFARYQHCDPLKAGLVGSSDQLLPLFVMDTLGDYAGFPGLFVAGITCASLSSVSTGLNSLSAIVTHDYLKQWLPDSSDATLLRFSKTFCVIFGAFSFGCIFVAEQLGNILPATFAITGIVLGPILGVFTLGLFFPIANSKGTLLGLLCTFLIMISLVMGNQLAAFEKLLPDQTLSGLDTSECASRLLSNSSSVFNLQPPANGSSLLLYTPAVPTVNDTFLAFLVQQGSLFEDIGSMPLLLDLFSISVMWYPALGCSLCIFFGLIFSLMLTNCEPYKAVNPHHISPPVLWLIMKLFPAHALKWIDLEDQPISSSPGSSVTATLSLRSTDFSFNKESICDVTLKRVSVP